MGRGDTDRHRRLRLAGLVAALLSVLGTAAPAQRPADRLERVVILSRHGVRGPMSSPEELGRYTRLAWPHFSAPPGILTARGAALMTIMGSWYRTRYQAAGLLTSRDCSVYLWANHSQRTAATAKALAEGLAPGCELAVNQSPQAPDPLFDAPLTPLAPPNPARLLAALSARVGGNLAAWDARQRPDLDRLEALLLQCARVPCRAAERAGAARRLEETPIALRLDRTGALQLSSPALAVGSLAESLVMAYADGLDFAGWRGIDARTIGAVLPVYGSAIDLTTRTPEVGRQSSLYLAMRLLATLQRGAHEPVLADPIGNDEKVVLLAGHDGTITMLAGLLGLNWHLPGFAAGEASPGGALIFELWRHGAKGEPFVRVLYAAQTLDQMRSMAPLGLDRPPAIAAVPVPGCADTGSGCPLRTFTAHVLERVARTPGR
jgi:4-phytase/acid phosphatase